MLVLPFSLQAQDGSRSLHWRELAVSARLDADGRLHVRERQAMVFDGAWNGGERVFRLGVGQRLDVESLTRLDPAGGDTVALSRGSLDEVDRYDWQEDRTLRWRSRLESDPPFANREIVYQIDYVIAPVLNRQGDEYLLRHDFAFPERDGMIQRFELELVLDSVWNGVPGNRLRASAGPLAPGESYLVERALTRAAAEIPAAVTMSTPMWARAVAASGAVLVPFLLVLGLRRRDRDLDRVAPLTSADAIDEPWLRTRIFRYPAEVVGASWDRSVGEAEVAATLARLVSEEKLASRIDAGDDAPVLHLERLRPLSAFAAHERELLEALFFDGSEHTDTAAVRRHYEKSGFDPAGKIRKAVMSSVDALPGRGNVKRRWAAPLLLLLLGIALAAMSDAPRRAPIVLALSLVVAGLALLVALPSAAYLARRVTHRGGLEAAVLLPITLAAGLLILLAGGAFEGARGLGFYHPGPLLLIGLLAILAGTGLLAHALAQPTETVERLAFRRQLVSARSFFERELRKPEPKLQDRWFPYLLAFGLSREVDRWFAAFGAEGTGHRAGSVIPVPTGSHGGPSGGGWSGGGPQFGGGTFAGGGAGGSWSVAAAGMAAGVAAPSSGSSGGGGVSSGGGGGGGW